MSQWCDYCKKWTWWTRYRDGYSCNGCEETRKDRERAEGKR